MILSNFRLYRYCLPLRRSLSVGDRELRYREGLIVVLQSDREHTAIGEVAPLPGYSPESLDEAVDQLRTLRFGLIGAPIPDNLEELSGGFDHWLGEYAGSVRFGMESAVLHLLATKARRGVESLLSEAALPSVPVNALLDAATPDLAAAAGELIAAGYRTIKLKVGRCDLKQDIAAVKTVREAVGPDVAIRLDANQRFTVDHAATFLSETSGLGIEYLEEPTPVDQLADLVAECSRQSIPTPLARDESLAAMSPEQLAGHREIGAVVLKPSLLGLERSMQFARFARSRGLKVVVSAMFESSVAISHLARFAATVMDPRTAAGLDTISWLSDDVLAPRVSVIEGRIPVPSLPSLDRAIQWGALTEVALD